MTIADLKKLIANMPDDAAIVIDTGEEFADAEKAEYRADHNALLFTI